MRAVDVIARKRDGEELTDAEIRWFVDGAVSGVVADYQAAAWLMAVYLRGMSRAETIALTLAMAESGSTLDLGSLAARAVDKHSTGGVGDKTSLVTGPLAAATGVIVPKMSGRGLGITGGTLDKLESIPGFRVDRTEAQLLDQLARIGIAIVGQTPRLAPADGKLYALRDVTATVGSLPLIVSSILSKKIAGGAPSIVLDVKAGSGAFMPTVDRARELATNLVEVGRSAGRRVVAYVTNMSQPLGRAVGNAVEVREAIETLKGNGAPDFVELTTTVAAEMVLLAGLAEDEITAAVKIDRALRSGAGLEKLRELIAAQGGNARVVDDPNLLPTAPIRRDVLAPRGGYVAELDAGVVGETLMTLGAGRATKADQVDPRVGVVFWKKVGDQVVPGESLFTLHLVREDSIPTATERLLAAYRWSDEPVPRPKVIVEKVPLRA